MINLQDFLIPTYKRATDPYNEGHIFTRDNNGSYCYSYDVKHAINKLVNQLKELQVSCRRLEIENDNLKDDYKRLEHEYALVVSPRYAIGG